MIIRFNRHEIFSEKMMEFHSQTLRLVEDYHMGRGESWYDNPIYNMLCGIWDGYFYTEMIPMAKELRMPESIINRIDWTECYINELH